MMHRRGGIPIEGAQPKPEAGAETADSRHRKWFAQFAAEHVMPLLTHTVEALQRRGFAANCRLIEDGDNVTAELVVIPRGLPHGAKPPRFAVSAAPGIRGLGVDYTGTFPHSGPEGTFGAEIIYDTVYTSELEQQLLEFVGMATGA